MRRTSRKGAATSDCGGENLAPAIGRSLTIFEGSLAFKIFKGGAYPLEKVFRPRLPLGQTAEKGSLEGGPIKGRRRGEPRRRQPVGVGTTESAPLQAELERLGAERKDDGGQGQRRHGVVVALGRLYGRLGTPCAGCAVRSVGLCFGPSPKAGSRTVTRFISPEAVPYLRPWARRCDSSAPDSPTSQAGRRPTDGAFCRAHGRAGPPQREASRRGFRRHYKAIFRDSIAAKHVEAFDGALAACTL